VDEYNRGSDSQLSCPPGFSTTFYAKGEKDSTADNYSKKGIL